MEKKFVKTLHSNRTFAAFQKIKSELKLQPVPDINREQLTYFIHDFRKNSFTPTVFNIDLKSAYSTVLFKKGLITRDTYDYLSKLNKHERLASVGMIAGKKLTFSFKNGEPFNSDPYENPLSNFFFYAVKETHEIMQELKKICAERYLFTWVDGIYFLPDEDKFSQCCEYLDSIKFPYSWEILSNFDVRLTRRSVRVMFRKTDSPKIFNLPHADQSFQKTAIDSIILINSKQKTNEKSKIDFTGRQSSRIYGLPVS